MILVHLLATAWFEQVIGGIDRSSYIVGIVVTIYYKPISTDIFCRQQSIYFELLMSWQIELL